MTVDPDLAYCINYLWPPREGLIDPHLADLSNVELAWWAWSDSRSSRRQVFGELIGRDVSDEVTAAAWDGWSADGEPGRTAACRRLVDLLDPDR